jgi:hypothetical protein
MSLVIRVRTPTQIGPYLRAAGYARTAHAAREHLADTAGAIATAAGQAGGAPGQADWPVA